MHRFEGRVAFVTGAAHGIGRATALRLRSEGASVVLADVDEENLAWVANDVAHAEGGEPAGGGDDARGAQVFPVRCDVTDRRSVSSAVASAVDRFGALDVLVNTAGGANGPEFDDFDDDGWLRVANLNLQGVVRCIDTALPHLLASSVGGSVVSISSVNGLAAVGSMAYSAAKAGLENLTRNLAVRYGRRTLRHAGSEHRSVRFNTVAPGTVRTRVWTTDEQGLDKLENLRRMYPLDRVGEPEDIAAAVAFLASDDASWITGVTLPVDGGLLTGPLGAISPED
ncbi:SDR family oxidoreductase [Phytoactinopolyspora alkaliphila]|uniref:SDR family oxidoreductase n=1 Tax=Phytoactinopolyspora alkaliphila TaxID=1783498 RepID=A0A6N9YIF2_9ACTN|nr:SDR family oxidoreductase [Phytoactinopolyspora alkaliphila]NED94715.1 SDR family oxidoreductase [Phytoactinopolyspora alkaliphila]